uniref:Uncharacterized protein n=1 Tax=Solanum tuberosum TaxID=4113 RepID=M1AYZ2_SOLTU
MVLRPFKGKTVISPEEIFSSYKHSGVTLSFSQKDIIEKGEFVISVTFYAYQRKGIDQCGFQTSP